MVEPINKLLEVAEIGIVTGLTLKVLDETLGKHSHKPEPLFSSSKKMKLW